MKKRILSLILVIVLMLSNVNVAVFAEEEIASPISQPTMTLDVEETTEPTSMPEVTAEPTSTPEVTAETTPTPEVTAEPTPYVEEGYLVTFLSYDRSTPIAAYRTDAYGYLHITAPVVLSPDGSMFAGWERSDGDIFDPHLFTTSPLYMEMAAFLLEEGAISTATPLEQVKFTQDTFLCPFFLYGVPELYAIEDIDNSYSLTIPFSFNGQSVTVTLSADLYADSAADEFDRLRGKGSVESNQIAADVILKNVVGKDSATYTITVGSGESAYSFDVKIIDNVNIGGPGYEVTFTDYGNYISSNNTISGQFIRNDQVETNKFEATATSGLSASELIDFNFTVNWNDNNNPSRPTDAVYTLYANNQPLTGKSAEVTPVSYNTVACSFPRLPKYDGYGAIINYTVSETMQSSDYIIVHGGNRTDTSVGNGGKITNNITVPVHINKLWHDGEDRQNRRPDVKTWAESLTLNRTVNALGGESSQFFAVYNGNNTVNFSNGTETITAWIIPEGNNWTLTTEKLECFDELGEMYVYYFNENATDWGAPDEKGDRYVQSIESGSITASPGNIYNGDTAISLLRNTENFEFYKVWNDNNTPDNERPTLNFYLYRYAIKPDVQPFTGAPVQGNDSIELIPTNTYPNVVETDHNNWQVTYAQGLPKYDDEGYPYVYFILEEMTDDNASHYSSAVDNADSIWGGSITSDKYILSNGTIINSTDERFSPSVTKKWETADLILPGETRPVSANFVLEKKVDESWEQVGDSLTISGFTAEQKTKMAFFPPVERFDENGAEITYRIREITAVFMDEEQPITYQNDWTATGTGMQIDTYYMGEFTASGYNFTTTYSESNGQLLVTNSMDNNTEFGIHKDWSPKLFPENWEGEKVASITVQVYQNNNALDLNTLSGRLLIDYDTAVVKSAVVNPDGTLTINCTDNFNLALSNLPKYDENGVTYRYTAVEINCTSPYNLTRADYEMEDTFTVGEKIFNNIPVESFTNAIGPGDGMRLAAEKIWKDTAASNIVDEVTVGVYHKNSEGIYSLLEDTVCSLNAGNYWYADIIFLPVDGDRSYDNYVVREIKINGADVSYDAAPTWLKGDKEAPNFVSGTGYAAADYYWQVKTQRYVRNDVHVDQITNLWLGYVNLEVSKTWHIGSDTLTSIFQVRANNQDMFTFTVSSDGTVDPVSDVNKPSYIEVTDDVTPNSRTVTLKNFPKYDDNGYIISYSLEEIAIIDGNNNRVNFDRNVATVNGKRVVSSVMSEYIYGPDHHSDDWMKVGFTNTFNDSSPLEVYKVWRDGEEKNALSLISDEIKGFLSKISETNIVRPDISLNLMRISEAPDSEPELVESDCKWNTKLNPWLWKSTFDDQDFPMYDENGYDYLYYVTENVYTSVPGWERGYYERVPVSAALHGDASTTEDTFSIPTAEANGAYAIAQYIKYRDIASPYEVGVVLNYLSANQNVSGTKIWANLPSWYSQKDFGDVYLGIFHNRTGTTSDIQKDFVSSFTLGNGQSGFTCQQARYDEFGYIYEYYIKELLPINEATDTCITESVEGGGVRYWEICEEGTKTYRGYRVTYSGDTVTNTYTGAPYVSFDTTKAWDFSQYLTDYSQKTEIEYPEITFTLTMHISGGYSEPVAALTLPGGKIIRTGDNWSSEDPDIKVDYDPNGTLTVTVSKPTIDWQPVEGTSCPSIIDDLTGKRLFPTYGPDGKRCTYSISEEIIEGYTRTEYKLNDDAPVSGDTRNIEIGQEAIDNGTPSGETSTVSLALKNKFTETKATLKATKIWNDQSNKYNTRPDPLNKLHLNLYQNGTLIYSDYPLTETNEYNLTCDVSVDSTDSNNWIYTFSTTASTPSDFRFPSVSTTGVPYTYRVEEVFEDGAKAKSYNAVAGTPYSGSANKPSSTAPSITNTLLTTKVKVDKEWVDQNNKALTLEQMHQLNKLGYMPTSVEFQVFYKDVASYKPFKDASGAEIIYSASWDELYNSVRDHIMLTVATDLPKYDEAGDEYEYIAKEMALIYPSGRRIEVSYSPEDGLAGTITGAPNDLFTSVSVTVNSDKGYSLISNKMAVRKLIFVKYWEDDNNRDSYRPSKSTQYSITLVDEKGETSTIVSTLPVSGNGWTIEQNETVDGVSGIGVWEYEITVPTGGNYTAYENMSDPWASHYAPVSGSFEEKNNEFYLKSGGDNYSITNRHEPDTIEIPVAKKWKDQDNAWDLRQNITLWLTQNNSKNITYLKPDLETYRVTYSEAQAPDGQITTDTNNALTKDSTVILLPENSENATVTWMNLPRYQPKTPENVMKPSVSYTYKVVETQLNGYKAPTYSKQSVNAGKVNDGASAPEATVTNTLDTVDQGVKKTWDKDFANAFKSRGCKAIFFLLKQNDKFLKVTLVDNMITDYIPTEDPPATAEIASGYLAHRLMDLDSSSVDYVFTGLPKSDDNGVDYIYTVVEYIQLSDDTLTEQLTGYENNFANGTMKNTLNDTTTLSVNKTWIEDATDVYTYDDVAYRPKSIEFTVHYRHNPAPCEHGVSDGWQASAVKGYAVVSANDPEEKTYILQTTPNGTETLKLPKKTLDGACSIEYKAVENTVTGYYGNTPSGTESTGDANQGFTTAVTNTQRTTKLTAYKEWDVKDYSDTQLFRPEEVIVKVQFNAGSGWKDLKQKGSGQPVTMTLNQNNGWKATVDKLLYENAAGTIIQYRVVEIPVPSGYTVVYEPANAASPIQDNALQNGYEMTAVNTINRLRLSKFVTGGDPNASFTFRVDVSGDVTGRAYPYRILQGGGAFSGTVISGGTLELRNEQTAVIYGIANGAQVTITEVSAKKADGTVVELSKAYTTTVNGANGTTWSKTINGSETDVAYTNTYKSAGSLPLPARKTLSGRTLEEGQFSFTLYGESGAVEGFDAADTIIETVNNKQDGTISFTELKYDQNSVDTETHKGTYIYYVNETGVLKQGYSYDSRVYTLKVDIEDKLNGIITVNPTYTYVNSSEETVTSNGIAFANTYEAEGDITINGSKILNGRDLAENEFSFELFELIDESNKHVQTVKNAADGSFSVTLNYVKNPASDDTGLHTYTLKEVNNGLGGVDYDDHIVTIKVQVTDNGDGTLSAKFAGENEAQPEVVFTNTYEAKGEITITGSKTLAGRPLAAEEFSFELLDGDTVIQTVKNAADGRFSITLNYVKNLDRNDTGLHVYTLKEVNNGLDGVKYDEREVTIKVLVTDNRDGTLAAKFVGDNNAEIVQPTAEFVNTYEAKGEITITGSKTLNGRDLAENEFSFELFELIDEDNKYVQTVKNAADGSFSITLNYVKNLDRNDTGLHTYILKEVDDGLGGVDYDDHTVTIQVQVTDNGNGKLEAKFVSDDNTQPAAVFTNIYKAQGEITITGSKTLTGRNLAESEFNFELFENGEKVGTANNDVHGNFSIRINYVIDPGAPNDPDDDIDNTGLHTYTLKEVKGELGGVKYDEREVTIKVLVTDNRDGTLTAKFVDDNNAKIVQPAAEFVNTYEAKGEIIITGSKTLNGRDPKSEEFSFDLLEGDEVIDTVKNDADGSFSIKRIYNVSDVGCHVYTLKEVQGSLGGVTYDKHTVTITVLVTDNGDGTLDVRFVDDPQTREEIAQPLAEFTNTYKAEGGITITGSKTLAGRPLHADEFSFELLEGDNVIKTVRNAANGGLSIDLSYAIDPENSVDDTGLHTYILREAKGSLGGVDYDDRQITIRVLVTDKGDGSLEAIFVNEQQEKINQPLADFGNIYKAKGSITITGSKKLNGRVLKADEFSFELLEKGTVIKTVKNAADGSFSITLDYTLDPTRNIEDTGLYTYILREVPGQLSGVTYDTHQVTLSVLVTDNGDGTLRVKCVDSSLEAIEQPEVLFVNTYKAVGDIVLTANKRLVSKKLNAGQFTFGLFDANGRLLQTAVNDADGRIVFAPLSYNESDIPWEEGKTEAEFIYTVWELQLQRGDYIYDKTVYTAKVTVRDLANGKLDVQSRLFKNNVPVEEMKFVNHVPFVPGSPKTGSDFNLPAWLIVQFSSLAALCAGVFTRKRKKGN